MRFLFISRRNNQAKYFKKLIAALGNNSALHIVGSPSFHGFRGWRIMWRFNPCAIATHQFERRKVKHPLLERSALLGMVYRRWTGLYERYRFASYVSLFTFKKPDCIGLWNGLKLPNETIVAAARAVGVKVMFFENGLLPGTCSIDPAGVNEASSLPRNPSFYRTYPFRGSPVQLNQLKPRKPVKSRRTEASISLPERFIFVPFQVPDDTQIIRHSPWIKSMEELYQVIMSAIDQCNDPELTVVFKEHPSWPGHFDDLYHRHPRAIFANGNPTPELIANCQGLVTINSTVGLEGIQLNKKVIVLGNSCYRIPGLVMATDDSSDLLKNLNALDNWQVDDVLRTNYLRFLNEVYAIPQNWSAAGEKNVSAATQRLLGEDEYMKLQRQLRANQDQSRPDAAVVAELQPV